MPSSLVFAALALAWIVVLVPMVARRRQEVRRTADSALAARVVHRGDSGMARVRHEEVSAMPEDDEEYRPEEYRPSQDHRDEQPERRYRPGRGGFDPYAAELAARAKYAFRQRVVLCLLLTAVVTGVLAFFALPTLWWVHGGADTVLVTYLGYLRRQVRIEQEVRRRRLERSLRTRRAIESRPAEPADDHEVHEAHRPERAAPPPRLPKPVNPPGTVVVDLDDEDPALYELDTEASTPYRRAVGE